MSFEPQRRATDLNVPLKYLNQLIKRRCTAFLISDFYHWGEDYRQTLSLTARRHDLVAIRTYDEGALELPRMGLLRLYDAETGQERWVDTSSRRVLVSMPSVCVSMKRPSAAIAFDRERHIESLPTGLCA